MDSNSDHRPTHDLRLLADRHTGMPVAMKIVTRPSRSSRSRHRAIFVIQSPTTGRAVVVEDIRLEQN